MNRTEQENMKRKCSWEASNFKEIKLRGRTKRGGKYVHNLNLGKGWINPVK